MRVETTQAKEANSLREEQLQVVELRNELTKLRATQQASKQSANRLAELESLVEQLTAELEGERKEKDRVTAERENIRREKDEVRSSESYSSLLTYRNICYSTATSVHVLTGNRQ